MANTTSYKQRRPHRGAKSPKREGWGGTKRPLRYKTALGLAFEALAERMGLTNFPSAPLKTTEAWEGTKRDHG